MSRAPALLALVLAGCVLGTPAPSDHKARPKLPPPTIDTHSIGITWIGHATVLIRIQDKWILTDPVLFKRVAHVTPRNIEAGIDPKDLPPLDAVVVSHAHFDHLDVPSLEHVKTPAILVPPGAAKFVPKPLHPRVAKLSTWEAWTTGELTITAVPASHGDGRYLIDRWTDHSHTGYVISYRGLNVYFAGDTGYVPSQTAAIRERFPIDVALIPVGPAGRAKWIERWRADVHTTPEHAMELFKASGAQWMIPIHYGAFYKNIRDELPLIHGAIRSAGEERRVRVLGVGESTEFLY